MQADTELLDLMMADHNRSDPRWQATAYWRDIVEPLTAYLREPEQLDNFRRAPIRTGIRSVLPSNPGRVPRLTGRGAAGLRLARRLPWIAGLVRYFEETQGALIRQQDHAMRQSLRLRFLVLQGEARGWPILEDSLVGNPDDTVEIDGRHYAYHTLGYQYLYARAAAVGLNGVQSVLELGSGYGGQAEVFLRHHPALVYAAVDIPPWLYVAELYLKSLFPGEVCGYREVRESPPGSSLKAIMKGRRIVIVPAWKWKDFTDHFDLFWNSKSLQEMNDNARPYLHMAMKSCRQLFLHVYAAPREGIHHPDVLKAIVAEAGSFRQLMYEANLFENRGGVNMAFRREGNDKMEQAS